jgi:L-amino acid N-acyltransferase YncA
MKIREGKIADFEGIWPIFHEITTAGETYAYPQNTSKEEAKKLWMHLPCKTFIAEEEGHIVGTYCIKTNQSGPGNHVCNCGYMVSSKARDRGIATILCEHSQKIALELGYKAM